MQDAIPLGAHVDPADPPAQARARGADAAQFFLSDPQGWHEPEPRTDTQRLRDSGIALYVHAPYMINVASLNNRLRIPSRKLLLSHARAAAAIGARALIVHGGYVNTAAELPRAFDNWRKTFAYAAENGGFGLPILIENTAGGDSACARRFDALARLWQVIGSYEVGFCLDTCHAHAAGEDLDGIVDRVRAITGRIDLVHANGSKGDFGSGQDRHDNLTAGTIDPDMIVDLIGAAGAPVIVETPGGVDGQTGDIAFLRARLGARAPSG